jgi:hypothetical protein
MPRQLSPIINKALTTTVEALLIKTTLWPRPHQMLEPDRTPQLLRWVRRLLYPQQGADIAFISICLNPRTFAFSGRAHFAFLMLVKSLLSLCMLHWSLSAERLCHTIPTVFDKVEWLVSSSVKGTAQDEGFRWAGMWFSSVPCIMALAYSRRFPLWSVQCTWHPLLLNDERAIKTNENYLTREPKPDNVKKRALHPIANANTRKLVPVNQASSRQWSVGVSREGFWIGITMNSRLTGRRRWQRKAQRFFNKGSVDHCFKNWIINKRVGSHNSGINESVCHLRTRGPAFGGPVWLRDPTQGRIANRENVAVPDTIRKANPRKGGRRHMFVGSLSSQLLLRHHHWKVLDIQRRLAEGMSQWCKLQRIGFEARKWMIVWPGFQIFRSESPKMDEHTASRDT